MVAAPTTCGCSLYHLWLQPLAHLWLQAHLDLTPTQRAAAAHRGAAEAMAEHARVAALEHEKALQGTSFSFEGTSLDWQRFARAWNAIVQSLRQRDMVLHLEY